MNDLFTHQDTVWLIPSFQINNVENCCIPPCDFFFGELGQIAGGLPHASLQAVCIAVTA